MKWLELRVPPPVVGVAFGVLMWAVAGLVPSMNFTIPGAAWIAAGCAAVGVGIAGLAIVSFKRKGTTSNPMSPATTSTLVTGGVYAWTRNPMYLGWLPIGLGWAVYLQNPVPLLLVPLFMGYITVFQIRPEERALETKFGPAYDAYRRRVRRWL